MDFHDKAVQVLINLPIIWNEAVSAEQYGDLVVAVESALSTAYVAGINDGRRGDMQGNRPQ